MSILVFSFAVAFALLLLFVAVSAARRGVGTARRDGNDPVFWSTDGGASFSDSGADCGSSSDGGGSCDGGGGSH